jgi:hypothetical protein
VSHLILDFNGVEVTGLAAFRRTLHPAAPNALPLLAPVGAKAVQINVTGHLTACTRGNTAAASKLEAVQVDLQCQGAAMDVCACADDASVRCVLAGSAAVTLPDFVVVEDFQPSKAGQMPWCEDDDDVDGWMLLMVRPFILVYYMPMTCGRGHLHTETW